MRPRGSRHLLTTILAVAACVTTLAAPQVAGAASIGQSKPAAVNTALATVSGTLVAKPVTGEGNIPPICLDRDRAAVAQAVQQNRGLVICSEEGRLVLLQLSPSTRLIGRDGHLITVSQMKEGDHINASGVLQDAGHLLDPTYRVQDTSIIPPPPPRTSEVSGILVAKPVAGEATIPPICLDRNQAAISQAVQQNRGLVICTEEGRLVLLELSSSTRLVSRYGGPITVTLLTDGDHLNAWGVLQDAGHLLNPTDRVQDTDVQGALTNSQGFISQGGANLTLMVLRSDANGPVQGIVHAVPGGPTRVILCGGRLGSWENLMPGKTIDISQSLFNRRTMTYIRTSTVRVVSCP